MISHAIDELQVPIEVKEFRLGICDPCDFVLNKDKDKSIQKDGIDIMRNARCGECGCFLWVKTGLKDFTCPIGKW